MSDSSKKKFMGTREGSGVSAFLFFIAERA
jgi:hypothetical protein